MKCIAQFPATMVANKICTKWNDIEKIYEVVCYFLIK